MRIVITKLISLIWRTRWAIYTVIREFEAKDVRQVEDNLVFRIINLGSSDVCLDAIDLFKRPLSGMSVSVRVGQIRVWNLPSAVPS